MTSRTQETAMNALAPGSRPVEVGPLFISAAGKWPAGQLLSWAGSLADALPDAAAALNLCERRENFLVGFVALLMRGQTCLMPPSRAPAVVTQVMQAHPGAYVLDDSTVDQCRAVVGVTRGFPDIPPDRVVVVGYTSGSTGQPMANPKTWGSFVASTRLNSERLREVLGGANEDVAPWIVATVPPQHMYGMELSVLMPLLGGAGIHGAHPLYPADVASSTRGSAGTPRPGHYAGASARRARIRDRVAGAGRRGVRYRSSCAGCREGRGGALPYHGARVLRLDGDRA